MISRISMAIFFLLYAFSALVPAVGGLTAVLAVVAFIAGVALVSGN